MVRLGSILSASLKLLPISEITRTVAVSCSSQESAQVVAQYARKTSTLTGTSYFDEILYLRFAGVAAAVEDDMHAFTAHNEIDPKFWHELRDHTLPFFADSKPLWRISFPRGSWYHGEEGDLGVEYLTEWNGSLLWFKTQSSKCPNISRTPSSVRSFRNVRHELPRPSKYALRLKRAFDPQQIFNPGVHV